MTSYNLNKIKMRKSYSIAEITSLFGITRKTCSRWLKEGLKVVEESVSPILVMGFDLENFIKERRTKKKINLKENESLCMKCHKAVIAKIGSEQVIKTGKRIGKDNQEQLRKIGICEVCGTKINRFLRVCQ